MHNMMAKTNTAVWYTLKLLRVYPKSSYHKKKKIFVTMWGDGC